MGEPSAFFLKAAQRLQAQDPHAAADHLQALAALGVPADLLDVLLQQLCVLLPPLGQHDRCLEGLLRFLQASRSPLAWLSLFEREENALSTLLQVFASSQAMASWLIADPEAFDLLRLTNGQPIAQSVLQDEIIAQVESTSDMRGAMRVLREYRQRETLRIAYGELLSGHSFDVVTGQLSELAESILQAAVMAARREVDSRIAAPRSALGEPLGLCVLGLGRLGGRELDYSEQLELVLIHETAPAVRALPTRLNSAQAGAASSPAANVADYFQRLGQTLVRVLNESTEQGCVYKTDFRLRPLGDQGPLVASVEQARNYYDSAGRTWERQAFVKARPVAGDRALGEAFIAERQTWIYRRYLMRADMTGLAALKRRIERPALVVELDSRKTMDMSDVQAGIRDIEVLTQFLQLLHGGDEPSVRSTNSILALQQLRRAGCLTGDEAGVLEENYRWLRHLEQTAQITQDDSLPKPLQLQLNELLTQQRKLSEHLLQQALPDSGPIAAESDLILDPQPRGDVIEAVLRPFGLADPMAAYRRLQNMAIESIPFLSTRRCRHFLAAIAPRLLPAIAATPSPDTTLSALADVSESLGGKAGLWELFSAYPATLDLCVRLCASSPYLTSILTSNPGMIDELMDSLMLDSLPTHEELSQELAELCHAAVDIGPILHSFKNSMHLRVGVRDLLGKATIAQTHQTLASIAEVCLEQLIGHEFHRLVRQLGVPTRDSQDGSQPAAEMVVLAVGKLGGREPNYHSDVDVLFLFDVEGQTRSLVPDRRFESTTNRHFFNQLCQRIIHAVTSTAGSGRLYDMDVHWRPLGRSGELAITIDDMRRYFADGGGTVSERQALCKARPIWGSPRIQQEVMHCVQQVIAHAPSHGLWPDEAADNGSGNLAEQMLANRLQLQQGSGPLNLKRGVGGTLDVEFVVQLLQMLHAHAHPSILVPGTLEALQHLADAQLIDSDSAAQLRKDYQFLRKVESGIRLMNMSARHELPSDEFALRRLAFLVRHGDSAQPAQADALVHECELTRQRVRAVFQRVFDQFIPVSG